MFGLGPATRIYVALGATDMRKGYDGLYGLVRDKLGLEVRTGHLFLFANARRNRLKILYWDGTGLWSCAKRLERGRFSWPVAEDQADRVSLSHEELSLLLGGIDLRGTRRKDWYRKTISESEKVVEKTIKETAFLLVIFLQLSSSFTPLKMQDPELVNQLKERLPEALFEKLNALYPLIGIDSGSRSIRSGYWKKDCVWYGSRSMDRAAKNSPTRNWSSWN